MAEFLRLSTLQVRDGIISSGAVSAAQFDAAVALLGGPGFWAFGPAGVAVMGQNLRCSPADRLAARHGDMTPPAARGDAVFREIVRRRQEKMSHDYLPTLRVGWRVCSITAERAKVKWE